jgi:hypothetical protein
MITLQFKVAHPVARNVELLKFASKSRLETPRDWGKHAVPPSWGIKKSRAGGHNRANEDKAADKTAATP